MDRITFIIFVLILALILAPMSGSVVVFSAEVPPAPPSNFFSSIVPALELSGALGKEFFLQIRNQVESLKLCLSRNDKKILVLLSRQTIYLIEENEVVGVFPTLTAARGMETPPGRYAVLAKYRSVTMEGQIGTPLEYRVENVPWVLFFIDRTYAIHGNYWKPLNYFGKEPSATGSHGCIGLTPEDAKVVYDWAEVGTEIIIQE